MTKSIAVIGSRTFKNYAFLKDKLDECSIRTIISGGAKGADSMAERYAKENNISTIIILPNWKLYGRSAGIIRNKDIVKQCDEVVAFWDGKSKGTVSTINFATSQHKPITIWKF